MPTVELGLRPARTIFPRTVVEHDPLPLKSAGMNDKLGSVVKKGALRGAKLFQLTLEERRYCPTTCGMWDRCYGDNMWRAKRHVYSDSLLSAIEAQLWTLTSSKRYTKVLVRLHVLGDFPDVKYVMFWERMLQTFDSLYLYGYTHWSPRTTVGASVQLRLNKHDRARILLSCDDEPGLDVETEGGYALVVKDWSETPRGFVKCPAMLTHNVVNCVDCTLCFSGSHNVAFKDHSKRKV